MARVLFVALLVVVAACAVMAANSSEEKRCGKNEKWNKCGNSCHEPKCHKGNANVKCPTKCEPRCECVPGCSRNRGGQCVPHNDCGKNH